MTNDHSTKPFLHYVAEDLLRKHGHDLSTMTVVFPNKRASLFLNERLLSLSGRPVWSPRYCTISDLFRSQSDLQVADELKLVCDLYRSYTDCTGSAETLDRFWGWGEVLLSDFDDIDKSLAPAHGVFSNLRDLHSYDTVDYLSERQKEVLSHFFQDFHQDHLTKLREKFLQLWSRFADIYDNYNERLKAQGLAYEGALYREVSTKEHLTLDSQKYIFVGFHALQKVETALFRKIRQERETGFYWDFDHYYQSPKDPKAEEAGTFINTMLTLFPNELDNQSPEIYGHFCQEKHIEFIGSPTNNIQARYANTWLQDESRVKSGNKTAIVMCDEQVLPTLLHSIPTSIPELNVTTGFPLAQTPVTALVRRLLELSQFGTPSPDRYRLKYVSAVMRHPYTRLISPQVPTLLAALNESHHYFPRRDELAIDEGLSLLFRDLTDLRPYGGDTPLDRNQVVGRWLSDLLKYVAKASKTTEEDKPDHPTDPLFDESIFRMYTLVNRLNTLMANGDLSVDFITYQRLLVQLINTVNVPFHGEPAEGLQIMGVLETRNLDFDHLLLLSCNDGNMPHGTDTPSFIPYSLREAFGLTTVDQRASIYAYYFYRLLQRASDITIMYRNTADDKQTGEMSRFMLQMLVESGHTIIRKNLVSGQAPTIRLRSQIEKTPSVLRQLHAIRSLSPTALNHYLNCPLMFYYNHVAGIREPDQEGDEIDNRIFGNIFHDASQLLYDSITGVQRTEDYKEQFLGTGFRVERQHLEAALKSSGFLERIVDQSFKRNLFKGDFQTDTPEYNGLQLINREVIIHYLRQLLEVDLTLTPFVIRGLEGAVYTRLTVATSQGEQRVAIGGRIDRMDETDIDNPSKHRIRVVDYKTGRNMATGIKNVDDVFSPDKIAHHSDYYLQAMLYSVIVSQSTQVNPLQLPVSPALLFIQHANKKNYNPVLKFDKEEITDISHWAEEYGRRLKALVTEIMEPSLPFVATPNKGTCKNCPYKQLCGELKRGEGQLKT